MRLSIATLSDIATDSIRRFETELIEYLDLNYPEVGKSIVEAGELTKDMEEKLKEGIAKFKADFKA